MIQSTIPQDLMKQPLNFANTSQVNPFTLPPEQRGDAIARLFHSGLKAGVPALLPLGYDPQQSKKYSKEPLILNGNQQAIKLFGSKDKNGNWVFKRRAWRDKPMTHNDIEAMRNAGVFDNPYLVGWAGYGKHNLVSRFYSLDFDLQAAKYPSIDHAQRLYIRDMALDYLLDGFNNYGLSGSLEGWGFRFLSSFEHSTIIKSDRVVGYLSDGGEFDILGGLNYTALPYSLHLSGNTYQGELYPLQEIDPYTIERMFTEMCKPRPKTVQVKRTLKTDGKISPEIIHAIEGALQSYGMELTGRRWSKNFCCPNPQHEDNTPSAAYDEHKHVVKCWACGIFTLKDLAPMFGIDWQALLKKHVFKTDTPRRQETPNRNGLRVENTAETTKILKPLPRPTPQPKANQIVVDTPYVSSMIEGILKSHFENAGTLPKTILIKSDIGTGKTESIKIIASIFKTKRTRISGHRISLSRNTANRLDFTCYQDTDTPSIQENLAIVVNSEHKDTNPDGSIIPTDLYVIDESEQVAKHLLGKTFEGIESQNVVNLMCAKLELARCTLFMDAHLGEMTQHLIAQYDAGDVLEIVNTYQRTDLAPFILHPRAKSILVTLIEKLKDGKTCILATDSRNYAKRIGKLLAEYNPIVIHSENSQTDEIQDVLANINDAVANHQLIIYSPTVGSGVDITTPVDFVFGRYYGNTLTSEEILQQLGRARDVRGAIHVYVPNDTNPTKHNPETMHGVLDAYYDMYQQRFATLSKIYDDTGKPIEGYNRLGKMGNDPARRHLTLYGTSKAKDNRQFNRQRSGLIQMAREQGHEVHILPTGKPTPTEQALGRELKVLQTDIEEYEMGITLESQPMSDAEFRGRANMGKRGELDVFANRKYRIMDTYSVDETDVTPPLYDEWMKYGKGGELGRYLWLLMRESDLAQLDAKESELSFARQKNRVLYRRLYLELLSKALGLTHTTELKPTDLDHMTMTRTSLSNFYRYALEHNRDIKQLMKIEPRTYENPASLLRALLKLIGLNLTSAKETIDGQRVRVYRIDKERAQTMAEHATIKLLNDDMVTIRMAFLKVARAYAPNPEKIEKQIEEAA